VADNFGLKIGIEGEKEFKNAIREINQSFKVLGSEMNLVASQLINKISQLKPLLQETRC
jgi:phage-related protein